MTDVQNVIFEVIDEVNGQLPPECCLKKSPQTVIVGEEGVLDSLGVTNFLITLEEKILEYCNQSITLLNDEFLSSDQKTLYTVESIERYITDVIQ